MSSNDTFDMQGPDRRSARRPGRTGVAPEDSARAKEWFYRLMGTMTAAALTGAAVLAALGVAAGS